MVRKDDPVLYGKWLCKKNNAKLEGVDFYLTFDEYWKLKDEANLKTEDLGFSGKGYVLARYNDKGPYKYGNCRFITQSQNAKEKRVTEKSRKASSLNMKKLNAKRTSEELSFQIRNSKKWQSYITKKREVHNMKRKVFEQNAHKSYLGKKNSQFGTHWYTNGKENVKAKKCPEGFVPGRKL